MLDIGPRPASDRTEGMRTTSPWRLLPPMMIGLALWAARADAQDAAAGSAATEGVATTIESRGDKPGCVDWTYRVVPAPRNRQLRKVRLEFDFVNRCGREVSVVLARQTFDGGGGAVYGQPVVLEPGAIQSYIGSGKVGNYILFDPDRDRWLRFWVHQSDQRFRDGVYLELARCNTKYPPPDPLPPKPPHPACPPAIEFNAAAR